MYASVAWWVFSGTYDGVYDDAPITGKSGCCRGFITIIGVINQLEIELKAERIVAERASAKARRRSGDWPKTDQKLLQQAVILYESSDYSVTDVCKTVGVLAGGPIFVIWMSIGRPNIR